MKPFILIPARGGSKGIPGKNIRSLKGTPLIGYTIQQALRSGVEPVIVSTDDAQIADISTKFGAEVPFMRPAELATSEAKSIDVMIHAAKWLRDQDATFDTLVLLQPTSPFRPEGCIQGALKAFNKASSPSLISIRRVPDHYNPHWVFKQNDDGSLHRMIEGELISRRQDLPPAYHRDGAIYIVDIDYMITNHSIVSEDVVGFEIESPELINIDNEEDWKMAEKYL